MRTPALYLFLVGVPLLGLFGILRTGERIVPPHSIGGLWSVDIRYKSPPVLPCSGLGVVDGPMEMTISQSGTRAEASFTDDGATQLSLSLAGDSLTAVGTTAIPGCPDDELVLTGRLMPEAGRQLMEGVLARPDCPDCPTAAFLAVRR